jgi:hypothetical protein
VTTDWVYANYQGVDEPDVIRNFIRYATENWGATWVLLGGDTDLVPCRMIYLFSAGFEPSHDTVLCDLYYSDLDGTWDADEDGAYGEVADEVDMYPDVWIGRASVNTVQECNTFVSKALTYERNPPLYQTKELLLSSWVFGDNWGEYGNDTIAVKVPNHHTLSKLYHSQGDLYASAVLDSIEAGYHFIQQTAHCGVDRVTTGPNFVYNWNLDALTNGNSLPIYLIAGCLAGSFHRDCYAEHWVNNPNGGGVAACMNSGVAYAGDSGVLAYSEGLNVAFFDRLFTHGIHQIGRTLGVAKALTVPEAQVDIVYRLCTYELNLLGDPELPLWTDAPDTLVVAHDSTIESGDTTAFTIAVMDNDGTTPIDSAYVCCTCEFDSAFCHTGHTDANGNITFYLPPVIDSDTMFVTVTKRNYIPVENPVTILISQEQEFIRGDANSDLLQTVADAIYIVSHVYREGPCECADCCDVNDDGRITVGDAIYIAGHVYRSGLPPAHPYPGCGLDLTPDELECITYPCGGTK